MGFRMGEVYRREGCGVKRSGCEEREDRWE